MDTHRSLIMSSRWKWAANPCNTTHRSSSCWGVGVTAILKWGEKNGRKDEAVPAADSSWVLLPRQRHPPWRVTPWCFYHCLLSSKFNQPDSFPLDATEAKGGNVVYSIRAIKHGWTGCNLKSKKKSKHPPQTPSISCQGLVIWDVSFCLYIYF